MAVKAKGKGEKRTASKKAPAKTPAKQSSKKGGVKRDPAKVERFVEELARPGVTQGEAATAAGFTDNPASAKVQGSILAADPDIRARVEARRRVLLEHAQVESGEVVGLLASHMRGDMADLLPEDAFLAQAKARGVSGLIRELEITERLIIGKGDEPPVRERHYKIKLHSSQDAAAKLGALMERGFGEDARENVPRTEAERAARVGELLERGRLRLVGKPA